VGYGNTRIIPGTVFHHCFDLVSEPQTMIVRAAGPRIVVLGLGASLALSSVAACRRKEPAAPPVATPSVTLNHDRAPLGSPLDITYKFVVASDAHFAENFRVMSHVVDADGQMMWEDDHDPPVPTTQWKPGQTVEYTRTVFVRVYPYVGEAAIEVGLYSTSTQKRQPLAGDDVGQRAYKVARLQLQPQTENIFTLFKDGWHPAETAAHNTGVDWQWTKRDATLSFKNPKKDAVFYFDVDSPDSVPHDAQQVQVSLNDQPIADLTLKPKDHVLKRIPLTAAQLGTGEMAELRISVDKTFVPALVPASNSKDPRELGVRVFHAFVDAR
jgi:hypothetical protein